MVSLLNGFSQMGKAVSSYAHDAGLAEQKADLERQQTVLADQLATTRETSLAHVQGEESRNTALVTTGAQGAEQRTTQAAANALPLSAAQKSEDDYRKGSLAETTRHNQADEGKPIPGGYSSTFMVKDPAAPGGYRQVTADGKTFTPEMSSLMGALAERGVSLPTGFRSKEQQISLYNGILERNQGKTADEIADGLKNGQIQFVVDKKETTTAAGIAGKVRYAEEELTQSIPLARTASGNVTRDMWVTPQKLMQMKDSEIQDPALRDLKIKVTSVLNAYDMLAARGGTDVAKREHAHALLTSADSPEVFEASLKAFEQEAQVARNAARAATHLDSDKPSPAAAPAAVVKPAIPTWVKPGDDYSPSRNKARDKDGNEYGPAQ